MFLDKTVDLGSIVAKTKHIVTFKATDDVTNVHIVPPGCDCTQPIWDETKKEIRVTYTPKVISKYLAGQGLKKYESVKNIAVKFFIGGQERTEFLTIKATVTNG